MNEASFSESRILITGGTGTFGSAFVRYLLGIPSVQKIIIFSRDEYKQAGMQEQLRDPRLRFFLGDVRDLSRLQRAFHDVDVVVHAAALKQVPALEYNPGEAVKTNIIGTQNVIDAALDNDVGRVLFISSDKAVQPVNLYGATKLCAEKLCIAANAYRGSRRRTRFAVARYGNVWGSRGSLGETIARQRGNGIVTLTDERMTRFWISVDQVMEVIGSAIARMRGGEIFVPKMHSCAVTDVIKALAPECRIETIGLRPGEKLHETLITEYEARRTKDAGDVFVIQPEFDWLHDNWLGDKPAFPHDATYSSNHPLFLRRAEAFAAILRA